MVDNKTHQSCPARTSVDVVFVNVAVVICDSPNLVQEAVGAQVVIEELEAQLYARESRE